jgi:hypothetical protein
MHSSFIITGTGSLANIVGKEKLSQKDFWDSFFFIQPGSMAGGASLSSFHAYPAPVNTSPGSWRIVRTSSSGDP